MTSATAKRYFGDDSTCLFRWTEEGRELAWANGQTIAFHEELSVVLKSLCNGHLPGFVPLVLAMAISRDSWGTASRSISLAVDAVRQSQSTMFAETISQYGDLLQSWPEIAGRLDTLHQYFLSLPRTPLAKAEVLNGIFHRFESLWSEVEQKQIYEAFQAGLPLEWLPPHAPDSRLIPLPTSDVESIELANRPPLFSGFARDLVLLLRAARMLASCLRTKSAADVDHLIRTGLDSDLQSAPQETLSQSLMTRGLLEELSRDPEYRGFAELTRHLMAAFSLPGLLRETTELPEGGVSDISNRGTLDRLLLSELALDDLTLATRLALNEALFLKREVPPAPQAQSRAIILDNSLPVWGLPRLYIAAVGLAIHGVTPDNVEIKCFRPRGSSVLSFELGSREDLVNHLEHLEAAACPTACLRDLSANLAGLSEQAAPVLITAADVYENPDFRKQLDAAIEGELWVILAERNGSVTILNRTAQGSMVTRKIKLPLESILSGEAAQQLVNPNLPDQLPAILRKEQFPLRLSHHVRPGRVWRWNKALVGFADDGRVMLWTEKTCGAVQLCCNQAFRVHSRILLICRTESLIQFLVKENSGSAYLVTLTLNSIQIRRVDLRLGVVTDVVQQNEVALVFGSVSGSARGRCSAIDLRAVGTEEDCFLDQFEFEETCHARIGRVYRQDGQWRQLYYVGGVTKWVSQVLPMEFQKYSAIAELGTGEFLYLNEQKKLCSILDDDLQAKADRTLKDIQLTGFAAPQCHEPGADSVLLTSSPDSKFICFNTRTGERQFVSDFFVHRTGSLEYQDCSRDIQTRTPHYRFEMICVCANGHLLLIGPRGDSYTLTGLKDGTIHFREVPNPAHERFLQLERQVFVELPRVQEAGVDLRKAEFSDGSLAWLDSRGLLHLKSSNPSIPEVTLVMTGRKISGWLSSSVVFGDDYYCEPFDARWPRRVSSEMVWSTVLRPFVDHVIQSVSSDQRGSYGD